MTTEHLPKLMTPEEAADQLRHITAYEIRGMARRGEIAYVKGSRNKVLLTAEQVEALVQGLIQSPDAAKARGETVQPQAPRVSAIRATPRSKAMRRAS